MPDPTTSLPSEGDPLDLTEGQLEEVLERIKSLEYGPRGRQNEPGFEIVTDMEGFDPIRMIPVFLVLTRDNAKKDAQYRVASPHELFPAEGEKSVLELRDRIVIVRVRNPDGPVSQIVAGGRDDVAEVAGKSGIRWGLSLTLPGIARLAGFAMKLPSLLSKVSKKLQGED